MDTIGSQRERTGSRELSGSRKNLKSPAYAIYCWQQNLCPDMRSFLPFSLLFVVTVSAARGQPLDELPSQPADGKLRTLVIGSLGSKREVCFSSHDGPATIEDVIDPGKGNCIPVVLTNYELNKLLDGCKDEATWFGKEECAAIAAGAETIRAAKGLDESQAARRSLVDRLNHIHPSGGSEDAWTRLIEERNARLRENDSHATAAQSCLLRAAFDALTKRTTLRSCEGEECARLYPSCFSSTTTHANVSVDAGATVVQTWDSLGTGKRYRRRVPHVPTPTYLDD